jgi:malonyl CoA-acyl carrier protein transacylase
MSKIPIFAGLGSDVLFNDATKEQAIRDSRRTHGKILLHTCHKVFLEEVSRAAKHSEVVTQIDLDDFRQPRDLIEPGAEYQANSIVQNATLLVVQSLRLLALEPSDGHPGIPKTKAVGGFCVGLLTAVAVACSGNDAHFLQRAEECFRAAMLIGVASQRMRRKAHSLPSSLPWSLIVIGISHDEMAGIISSQVHHLLLLHLPIHN